MFVGGLDALKTTTYFTTQRKYAQHNNFKEDMPKIKYKPTYKGAIRFGWFACLFLVFHSKEKESALNLNVKGKPNRF